MRLRVFSLFVVGACCLFGCVLSSVAVAEPSVDPFEVLPESFHFVPSTLQAGAHEDLTVSFDFAHEASGRTHNDVRTITVRLPPGFDASNTAVPTCTLAELLGFTGAHGDLPTCPVASQVGQISFELTNPKEIGLPPAHITVPVYNMEVTSFGVAAQLGFKTKVLTATVQVGVEPNDTIVATSPNIPKVEARNISTTLWGVPAAHEHDTQRGQICGDEFEVPAQCNNEFGGPTEAGIPAKPFLANPTSCGTFEASVEAYSWENPLMPSMAKTRTEPITGCERVPFEPSVEAQPTTMSAESPSGLDATITVPQAWENPVSLATSNLKDATVTLPVGFTVNPGAGSGLGACTPQQYEAETSSSLPGQGCPPESKIGSIEIETPILAEKLNGAVYVATPFDNPFNSLLSLYIVAKVPDRGVIVKVAGEIHLDEKTGQLVTTFLNNPQQPFSRFTLKFRPGATAPLVSPPACGSYSLQASLTPWSAPLTPRPLSSPAFNITSGVGGGACPTGGVPPLKPQAISGADNNNAGSYSPFYLRLIREDGEQELTKFTTVLPPGLTGNLSGVPFCPDASIEQARHETGREQLADPSCPAASEIGHTIVGAGVGSVLAQTPGKVYLAGPYNGSALSLVSITSATVGPFDLGTVVIRFALRINPTTAQVEVDSNGSDPIPHIIDGVVVHVRDIRVYVDRTNFILNPTNCDPMSIANIITGAGADYTNPADQKAVTVTTPFQVADCASLGFKPVFNATVSGKTSRANGAAITFNLSYPKAPQGSQANIRSVKVDLPKQLPSRLSTLQKACPDSVFNVNPANCSAESRVGSAIAHTPILPVPLVGPAYFVSHGGAKFPELIMVLQGYGITIELHSETFISKQGITSGTFRSVPDQPVTSFQLTLPQGHYSALAANKDLCALTRTITEHKKTTITTNGHKRTSTRTIHRTVPAPLTMPTAFTAQNGLTIHQSTPVSITGCAKKKEKHTPSTKKPHTKHTPK
jgi:hypothetical protein